MMEEEGWTQEDQPEDDERSLTEVWEGWDDQDDGEGEGWDGRENDMRRMEGTEEGEMESE